MTMKDLSAYLDGPFREIEGWCDPWLWQVLAPLRAAQEALGVGGPAAEIGVHHGKLLIGLIKTSGVARGHLAIDAFDLQAFNLDHSGQGDLAALQGNLARCGIAPESVRIERGDSLRLSLRDVDRLRGEASAGFSFVSVDGCHEVEYALADMRLAMELAMPEGIILVDDFLALHWPGVTEAVARLYLHDRPRFVPLLAGYNKLLLCHRSHHGAFFKMLVGHINEHLPGRAEAKIVRLFGHRAITIVPDRSLPFDPAAGAPA